MKSVAPGDPNFCYWRGALRAYGIATTASYEARQPEEFGTAGKSWSKEGYKVNVTFRPIDPPVEPKVHFNEIQPLLPEEYLLRPKLIRPSFRPDVKEVDSHQPAPLFLLLT